MPLSPQPRQHTLTAGNHALDEGDQTVTKVDKTCHRQPPTSTPDPRKTQQHRKSRHPVNSIVNPSGAPRTTLNIPEQTRTPRKPNPNTIASHAALSRPTRAQRLSTQIRYPTRVLTAIRACSHFADLSYPRSAAGVPPNTAPAPSIHPSPIQSLPPSRGEVRWGVGRHERTTSPRPHPDHLPPHAPTLPNSGYPDPRAKVPTMSLSPQLRRPAPTPGNHSLTNGDQTVTKVDKTCHRQPPPQSQTPAKHSRTANPATPSTSLSTLSANPSRLTRAQGPQLRATAGAPRRRGWAAPESAPRSSRRATRSGRRDTRGRRLRPARRPRARRR